MHNIPRRVTGGPSPSIVRIAIATSFHLRRQPELQVSKPRQEYFPILGHHSNKTVALKRKRQGDDAERLTGWLSIALDFQCYRFFVQQQCTNFGSVAIKEVGLHTLVQVVRRRVGAYHAEVRGCLRSFHYQRGKQMGRPRTRSYAHNHAKMAELMTAGPLSAEVYAAVQRKRTESCRLVEDIRIAALYANEQYGTMPAPRRRF